MKNILLLILLIAALAAQSQPIAQFRGVNRNGIYQETGLLNAWPAEGPTMLWQTDTIGNGYGSPVVMGNKLYVNGEIDTIAHLFAFDLQGNLLWKTANGHEFNGDGFSAGFPGSRTTPTIVNGLVYILSGLGRIACIDAETGKEIWAKQLVKDFGGELNNFGYSESLLTDGNCVFCYPGGAESNVVCLDRFTGNLVWSSKAIGQKAAFCSPMLINLPERKLFVTTAKEEVFALDASNGELLWKCFDDSAKYDDEYCNTPIYSNGYIYCVPGIEKGKGAMKLKLSPDGKSVQEVWRNIDAKNLFNGFVVVNEKLYATSKNKKLWCVDTATGITTDTLKNLSGNIIAADNKLICYADNGNVNLIDISGPKMEVTGKFAITSGSKEHIAYPTISNGVLYIRHGKALMAYQVK
jgi:outer membrane protein assembly factor BamB